MQIMDKSNDTKSYSRTLDRYLEELEKYETDYNTWLESIHRGTERTDCIDRFDVEWIYELELRVLVDYDYDDRRYKNEWK